MLPCMGYHALSSWQPWVINYLSSDNHLLICCPCHTEVIIKPMKTHIRLSSFLNYSKYRHHELKLEEGYSLLCCCCCWVTQLCLTLCSPVDCSMPGFPVLYHLPELAQTHVYWVGDTIQPSHPLHRLLFRPSIFPSIRVFSNESALRIRWPKYWSFSFSISLCWCYYKMPCLICWINVFLPSHVKQGTTPGPWTCTSL